MKTCDYCGRETEDSSMFCTECGTPQSARDSAPNRRAGLARPSTVLDARSATIILVAAIATQVVAGTLTSLVGYVLAASASIHGGTRAGSTASLGTATAILLPLLTGAAVLFTSSRRIPESLKDRSPQGAAWVAGPPVKIVRGLVAGLVIGACCWAVAASSTQTVRLRSKVPSSTPNASVSSVKVAEATAAILLAAPVEEALFRGVLYGGYRQTFGSAWAAVITTWIFILWHGPQVSRSPGESIPLSILALAALWFRLTSGAIGPSIALHAGYNSAIACLSLALTTF